MEHRDRLRQHVQQLMEMEIEWKDFRDKNDSGDFSSDAAPNWISANAIVRNIEELITRIRDMDT